MSKAENQYQQSSLYAHLAYQLMQKIAYAQQNDPERAENLLTKLNQTDEDFVAQYKVLQDMAATEDGDRKIEEYLGALEPEEEEQKKAPNQPYRAQSISGSQPDRKRNNVDDDSLFSTVNTIFSTVNTIATVTSFFDSSPTPDTGSSFDGFGGGDFGGGGSSGDWRKAEFRYYVDPLTQKSGFFSKKTAFTP